ncbi:MAG: hypothetical protein QRY16_20340 [Enterobacterales bacterium endosymbiont of Blomia tropicalis]|uniref:Uncharacterized protein n=1 Tax=Blomia tropicalis TaxID=40697 RepID=A0A9Q0MH46_BLOTA|nr:hypothetical protein [Mixta mediterraneensis]KAJ6225903.1 hypothetical protein RDWZM_004448 [Blomia tropicalis]MDL4916024.1 hypothetical protein [Mixta mediterraneensis]
MVVAFVEIDGNGFLLAQSIVQANASIITQLYVDFTNRRIRDAAKSLSHKQQQQHTPEESLQKMSAKCKKRNVWPHQAVRHSTTTKSVRSLHQLLHDRQMLPIYKYKKNEEPTTKMEGMKK